MSMWLLNFQSIVFSLFFTSKFILYFYYRECLRTGKCLDTKCAGNYT